VLVAVAVAQTARHVARDSCPASLVVGAAWSADGAEERGTYAWRVADPRTERRELLRHLLAANAARRRRPSVLETLDAIVPGAVSGRAFRSVQETERLQDWVEAKVAEAGTSRRRWSMDQMKGALRAVASYGDTPGPVLLVPRVQQPAEAIELPDCVVLASSERLIDAIPYFALVSPDRQLGIAFDWGWRDHEGEWAELATWGIAEATGVG
jgi:hypothetical protein